MVEAASTVDEVVVEAASAADEVVVEAASTADEVVAEAGSKADEVLAEAAPTADAVVAEAASTADKLVAEAASTADEVVTFSCVILIDISPVILLFSVICGEDVTCLHTFHHHLTCRPSWTAFDTRLTVPPLLGTRSTTCPTWIGYDTCRNHGLRSFCQTASLCCDSLGTMIVW